MTDISDVIRVSSSGSHPFIAELRPVRNVVPAVETAGVVDATLVFAKFAEQAGPDVAEIGEAAPHEETSDQFTVDGGGQIVVFGSVRQVDANFTYRCRDVVTSGVVSSWGRSRTGLMQCDAKKPPTVEVAKEAAALAC